MDAHPSPSATRSVADPLRQVTVRLTRWHDDDAQTASDELVAEEPLEVRLRASDGSAETIAVIMRTPGQDEELAAGFLYGEGFLRDRSEVAGFAIGTDSDGLPSPNTLDVLPAPGVDLAARVHAEGYSRAFAVNSSCGVCGKNTVSAACATYPRLPADDFAVAPEVLYVLPDRLRAGQRVFGHTGGLHAAGLFSGEGELLALREDVGRHNAVDRLVGRALLDGTLPLGGRVLLVSGRLSFEIVLKALAAGIPIVAAVSAPSSLAVDLAEAGGVTLAAFLRGTTMNVYTQPQRVRANAKE